jgi:endo-1,4-beta-xylanase
MNLVARARFSVLLVTVLGVGCGTPAAPKREPLPEAAATRVEDPRTDVPLGTAATWSVLREDPALQAVIERAFDSVTPENEMKMNALQPERGKFRFDDADALVDWATRRRKLVRGHTLVWHQQVPKWLGEEDWKPDELEQVLTEHVRTVVGRYRGRVSTWDVVNEPLTDRGRWRSDDGFPFLDVLGPRYIEIALRAARAADPDAKLFINEIGAETGGPKLDALVKMAEDFDRRGVPLDGVGLESHLSVEHPPARAALRRAIERLTALDLDVELTELDVADPAGDARAQARVYRDAGAVCAAVRRCRRVTVWGVSDRDSWLGADQRPLPFDANLKAKPAWEALTEALAKR